MAAVFDMDKLYTLLKDFYRITHIRITVFDENLHELSSYPHEVAPYCKIIRSCFAGLDACLECDRAACAAADRKKGLHIYRCHAGLTEVAVPLSVEGISVGYLLFGHVFAYPSHEEGWKEISRRCGSLPIDREALKKTVFGSTILSEEYVRSAADILHAVASYLILERMAAVKKNKLAVMLDSYIETHYTEDISTAVICRTLRIGKTQLYKLSEQLYGCGIAKHIRTRRIDLAKSLLTSENALSLADIAEKCGFHDYNYFITVFSREAGTSPIAYRNAAL